MNQLILSIIILLAIVLIIAKILLASRKKSFQAHADKRRAMNQLEQEASFANATILHVEGGMSGEQARRVRIKLSLNILGEPEKSYPAIAVWLVDLTALSNVKAGKTIAVKINAKNPKLIYPAASWATHVPTPSSTK